jgi:probable HAF family extracellular repeat protein
MQDHRHHQPVLRQCAIACATLCLACSPAWPAPGVQPEHAAHTRLYSVINLGVESGAAALLNERGQAVFGSFSILGEQTGFFNGDRIFNLGSLGGKFTWATALNNNGVVVGESELAGRYAPILPFAWTVQGGMRVLPAPLGSRPYDVNDPGQAVGVANTPGITARAVRWDPDGTLSPLGPLPLSLSIAYGINACGTATGFADVASGAIHATLWDPRGNLTDLGTLGGDRAFGQHISDRNTVAGVSDDAAEERELGFFWSRNSGMVPIDSAPGANTTVLDLNNRGEVVGLSLLGESMLAYRWSLAGGVVPLPFDAAKYSDVRDINNRGEMVGALLRAPAVPGTPYAMHAVRWPGAAMPIDLNTRLHRAPEGLKLEVALAINDDGVILAHSNAGAVLLRPGTRGTDAPVLGPIMGAPDLIEVGQNLALTVGFVDNNRAQTHSASATWTDGCDSPPPEVTEAHGVGEVRLQHRFCDAGYFMVQVVVRDSGGRSTRLQRELIVSPPLLPFISGKGTLTSGGAPTAAGHAQQPLRFALWAPLAKDAGSKARPVVMLSGPFQFRSETVLASGAGRGRARLSGSGRLNGRDGYRFVLDADAGSATQGADRLRVRVTHSDPITGADVTDYDNGAPAPASARARAAPAAPAYAATIVREGALRLRQ